MRVALGISYKGTAYHGWQSQEGVPSVQASLETALSKIANHNVRVFCAGRTDAGVHALSQVVHFDTTAERDERAWLLGTNANLPGDIRVIWVKFVSDDFHARFSAIARRYRYIIFNHSIHSALFRGQVTWCLHPLDETRMAEAANYLLGEHDFNSFRAVACQAKSPIRTVQQLDITRKDQFIFIDIKANAFLHHMVRNIAGMLIAVGSGKREPIWAQQLLTLRDRKQGDVTAVPDGLYFMQAYYPEQFGLNKEGTTVGASEGGWLLY